MNDKFDELARGLAESATRRGALKKFGLGLAGIALALLGLANKAQAGKPTYHCSCKQSWPYGCFDRYGFGDDGYTCALYCSDHCAGKRGP